MVRQWKKRGRGAAKCRRLQRLNWLLRNELDHVRSVQPAPGEAGAEGADLRRSARARCRCVVCQWLRRRLALMSTTVPLAFRRTDLSL